MERKIFFGKWECTCILITLMGTKVVLNYPRVNVEIAGTAGWIVGLYSGLLTLFILFFILKLYTPFKGKDLIEIGELAAGKTGRISVGLAAVAFLLFIVSFSLRQFGEQMITMAFNRSPISYILIFFMVGTLIAAYLGLEAIVRFQAVLVPVSIIAFLIYLIGLAPSYDFSNLFPLLGEGPKALFIGGAPRISEFSELFVLFLLAPHLKRFKDFKKAGWMSVVASMFFMISLTGAYLLVFNYPSTLRSFLPAYELGRVIKYARFVEKLESILVITWATMAYMYLSSGFYLMVSTFASTFKIQYSKPLIPAFGIIVFTLSLFPKSLLETDIIIVHDFRNYSWIVAFGMTILVLLIARRSLKKTRQCSPKS